MQTDIIIIGAGIVGAALACALGRADFNVVLIDSQAMSDKTLAPKDLRVSAITYGCQQWLKALGAWQHLDETQWGVFRRMCVEEAPKVHMTFDSADLGIPTLGYIVPNQLLNQALWQELAILPQVQIIRPVQAQAMQFVKDKMVLILPEQQIEAKLIVGADGAQSWVREQCQFLLDTKPYDHSALVTNLQIEKSHQQCAYQQFQHNDILAFLPLSDLHECSLVWSGTPDRIEELKSLSAEEFTNELQKSWGNSLGSMASIAARITFPLTMRHAKSYVQDRVVIIGDAAHTIHPLAGQGLNLGLQDACCLANTLINTQKKQRDIGRYSNLRPFERARRWNNDIMLKTVAANKWFFAQNDSATVCLRQTGIKILNHLPFFKKRILQIATFGEVNKF